ncbi:hypothetical protein COCOBI_01-5360 [Coccomyxa sp. Obi]|nr:hypothetical protein COCOBI_01-5360 [Coccomyxa sp. Obi]
MCGEEQISADHLNVPRQACLPGLNRRAVQYLMGQRARICLHMSNSSRVARGKHRSFSTRKTLLSFEVPSGPSPPEQDEVNRAAIGAAR